MTDAPLVRVEIADRIALLTIHRPEKLNALNGAVLDALEQAFERLRGDDDVLGVVVTGAGEKAFVAGADIGELAELDGITGVETSRRGQGVFAAIERFPKPVLAAVGGYALGGGCELALACHLRVASDNALFGLPEVGLGIIPGYGGTLRLARLVGLGRAVEMTLTGDAIKAERAFEIGLVSAVVPRAELLERARALMGRIVRNGPVALRAALEAIHGALDASAEQAHALEATLFGVLASTSDMREGLSAFLEKRKPAFRGE